MRPQEDGGSTKKPVAKPELSLPFPVSLGWVEAHRPGIFVIRGYSVAGNTNVPLRITPAEAPKAPVNMTDLQAHVDSQMAAINHAADTLLGEPRKAGHWFCWSGFDKTHNKAMFEYTDNDGQSVRKAFVIVDPHTASIERVLFSGPMGYKR